MLTLGHSFFNLTYTYLIHRIVGYLESFLAKQEGSPKLDSLIDDAVNGNQKPLSDQLVAWFASVRVKSRGSASGELELPQKATFETYLSHISTTILERSQGRVDIKVAAVFTDFCRFLDGYKKNLKAEGKGEVTHYEGKLEC